MREYEGYKLGFCGLCQRLMEERQAGKAISKVYANMDDWSVADHAFAFHLS